MPVTAGPKSDIRLVLERGGCAIGLDQFKRVIQQSASGIERGPLIHGFYWHMAVMKMWSVDLALVRMTELSAADSLL